MPSAKPIATAQTPDNALTHDLPSTELKTQTWPSNMLEVIETIVRKECFKPQKPEFEFKLTKEAAAKNWLVLKKYNLSISQAIEA